jgi:hypothetical protein
MNVNSKSVNDGTSSRKLISENTENYLKNLRILMKIFFNQDTGAGLACE